MYDYNEEVAKVEHLRDNPKIGLGVKPAVVVVDFQLAFTEPPHHEGTTAALKATATLLEKARSVGVPVIFVGIWYDELDDVPLFWRNEEGIYARCKRGLPSTEMHPLVPVQEGDIVVEKTHASGFYNTVLDEKLKELGVDTLLVAGTSTSGCVRCTAVDGAARSYRVMLVDECCDDWRPVSTAAVLYDFADRYGNVVHLDDMLSYLDTVAAPMMAGA